MQRKKTFLVVCISILTSPLWAQTEPPGLLKNSLAAGQGVQGLGLQLPVGKEVTLLRSGVGWQRPAMQVRVSAGIPGFAMLLAEAGSGYYIGNLGYFCRKELQMEKATGLPLRIRLGSLQEVNRLEGKPGW
jgi:hypothetical protein